MKAVILACFATLAMASPAWPVLDEDETPPEPTETVTKCDDGTIWDPETESCVDAADEAVNDDARYRAVRELVYAQEFARALAVIATAEAADGPRFLNYRGFIARKSGNSDEALAFYGAALAADPDYHLARSYMGQGLVALGRADEAEAQLHEIARRGGKGTWAYRSLELALQGQGPDY